MGLVFSGSAQFRACDRPGLQCYWMQPLLVCAAQLATSDEARDFDKTSPQHAFEAIRHVSRSKWSLQSMHLRSSCRACEASCPKHASSADGACVSRVVLGAIEVRLDELLEVLDGSAQLFRNLVTRQCKHWDAIGKSSSAPK